MRTLLCLAALAAAWLPARAHDAPAGWRYDLSCCSTVDCRAVPPGFVEETATGFRLTPTGETVPHGDRRLKVSPDGMIHWCSTGGADTGRTICLYMPSRGM